MLLLSLEQHFFLDGLGNLDRLFSLQRLFNISIVMEPHKGFSGLGPDDIRAMQLKQLSEFGDILGGRYFRVTGDELGSGCR